jgi:TRAP transporter 4TM/12TM fusion protein
MKSLTDSKTPNTELSQEEIDDLVAEYDVEAGFRKLKGILRIVSIVLLISFSIFQLYTAIFIQPSPQIFRTVHLGFALTLIFLLFPAKRKNRKNHKVSWLDITLSLLSILVSLYWPIFYDELVFRAGELETLDIIIGGAAILLILEATRRAVGLPITIIAIFFLAYAYYGYYMPGFLKHSGMNMDDIINVMYFTTEGILGTPLKVSATYIFLFLLFGAFLIRTGVGQYFNDLSLVVAGRLIGGPAKVAIFSSALQGTISGSSVANVVTSGVYTIPMMKNLGYGKNFAGAVEAASSTGGQIMPPIMGAAAFLMAEFTGIRYWDIAVAAIIPAVLYFAGIWIMTHYEAKRVGLRGLKKEELPNTKEVLKKIYLLLPIVVVVVSLMAGDSITRAALISIASTIVVGFIDRLVDKNSTFGWKDIVGALVDGARTALPIVVATAAAGMIVGIVTRTGVGIKLANGLIDLANNQLFLTLLFTMIACLILGMGSPTTANYIITATIAAPALIEIGVPVLVAHMFVFYFGIIADITPPVALAAFSAAGVSGGDPIKTGVDSSRLAIAAFIIPYIFVYSPEMLLVDTTWLEVVLISITSLIGMLAIGAGMIGYWMRKTYWYERILCVALGILLVIPGLITDLIGGVGLAILFAMQFFIKNQDKETPQQTVQA